MTQPDLELTHRRFMLALEAMSTGKCLEEHIPDRGDFGRKFEIRRALDAATKYLHEPFDVGDLAMIDKVFDKFGIKRCNQEKAAAALQLLELCPERLRR